MKHRVILFTSTDRLTDNLWIETAAQYLVREDAFIEVMLDPVKPEYVGLAGAFVASIHLQDRYRRYPSYKVEVCNSSILGPPLTCPDVRSTLAVW